MQNYNWQLDNFALGMHTEPAKTQGGERYAGEIQNLRIDSDGWLRERSEVMAVGSSGLQNITGIAATPKHVFVLRADGKLYIRDRDDLDTETEITGVADLDGRISVVDFNTYVILTSEGEDQGYWIEISDDSWTAWTLGIDPPDISEITITPRTFSVPGGEDFNFYFDHLRRNSYYVFRFSYARNLNPDVREIGVNIPSMTPELFEGTESVLSDAIVIHIQGPGILEPSLTFIDKDRNALDIIEVGSRDPAEFVDEIVFSDFIRAEIANPQANILCVYRAARIREENLILSGATDTYNVDNLEYRLINVSQANTIDTHWYTVNSENLAKEWGDQPVFVGNNDRIPAEVRSIHRYNDLIFAPAGNRLIYSDIRFGTLTPWAYPAVNEIRTGEQITFCAELREVLLFGGRGRLSRLTGTDEYNFNIDTLSHRGPLDGYSWNRLTEVLAYIGEGGFFVTDSSSVKSLSEPILNRIFKDRKLLTGSVVFLQDGDILFDFKTPDGRYQYKIEDSAWARWTGIDIIQAATIIEEVSEVDQATLVLLADGTGQLKELNWNSTEGADAADWHWESNIISGLSEGVANKFKRFRELEWTGEADGDVTLEVFNADAADAALSTVEFDSRDSLRPVRIPINRKMRRMIFRVSGTGTVKLQGLRLEMQV